MHKWYNIHKKIGKALILFEKSSIFVVNGFTSRHFRWWILFENAWFVCYTILWILLMLYYLISSAFFFSKILYSLNVLNQNFEHNITKKLVFWEVVQVFGKSPNYFTCIYNAWKVICNSISGCYLLIIQQKWQYLSVNK